MSKPQAKPEASQKSKLIFIGALLVTVAAFYLLSVLMNRSAVTGLAPETTAEIFGANELEDKRILFPENFVDELLEVLENRDLSQTASGEQYFAFDISDARHEDLRGKLILSLCDEAVCAFTLVFKLPEQPVLNDSTNIQSDLYTREAELYETGVHSILQTFDACAGILDRDGSVNYAALDALLRSIGQTMQDGKQREEKTDAYTMTADVREEAGEAMLHLSLEMKHRSLSD